MGRMASARQDAGNDLPAMPPINSKICVRGEQHRIVQCLGHTNKARIREADWHVGIFVQKPQHRFEIVAKPEATNNCASTQQFCEPWSAEDSKDVESL